MTSQHRNPGFLRMQRSCTFPVKGILRAGVLCVAAANLGGCALSEQIAEVGKAFSTTTARLETTHKGFSAPQEATRHKAAQEVARPWLAGRSQPLAREVTLPLALRANVDTTLLFDDGPLPLPVLAQRITRATQIPVHVRPEALLPPELFVSRLELATPAAPQTVSAKVSLAGGPEPLARTLDHISAYLGVMWRYVDERIEFYRTETRAFDVRALTLQAASEASLGQQGDNDRKGFSSASRTQLQSVSHDPLASVRARIEPFLSRAGTVVAEPGATAMVVVTDTPDVLRRVAGFIDRENRAMTRRVRLLFEELTVALEDGGEASIDWDVVFAGTRLAGALGMAGAGSPESGFLSLGVSDGRFAGSEMVVKALGQVGRVVRRNSFPVLTLNRRPVTHAVRTTFSYIDKVETTSGPERHDLSSFPTVSVSQREETVGSLITLVPDAQEDGQVLLSVAYDNTVAQPLKTVSFGDSRNPLQLQQITVDGNGTVQQVALIPGQPLVISGFDRSHQETESRRLNPGLPLALGGSDRVSRQRLTTVMVVTAHVEEGV